VLAIAVALAGILAAAGDAGARPREGERVVHHEVSSFGEIWVIAQGETRYLRFARDGIEQSAVRLGDPLYLEFTYTRALMGAFAIAKKEPRVLVVGLGGGTVPMLLRRVMPRAEIDVAELDPRVAAVAQAYLGFVPDDALRVHLGDGRAYLASHEGPWDVIVLDAYGADAIPYALATREFLELVRRRLAPGGLVAANVWSEAANPLYPAMLRTYEAVFPRVHVIRGLTGASRIVVAPRDATDWTGERFVEAAKALAARWPLRFDLEEIVRAGYEAPAEHPRGGEVLRDRATTPAPAP